MSARMATAMARCLQNFYSLTVYEKGAEIVRIYDTLLGQDGFRRGMVSCCDPQTSGPGMIPYCLRSGCHSDSF